MVAFAIIDVVPHNVGDKVCIGSFPDERGAAGKAERFTLLTPDCRINSDCGNDVQRARGATRH